MGESTAGAYLWQHDVPCKRDPQEVEMVRTMRGGGVTVELYGQTTGRGCFVVATEPARVL